VRGRDHLITVALWRRGAVEKDHFGLPQQPAVAVDQLEVEHAQPQSGPLAR